MTLRNKISRIAICIILATVLAVVVFPVAGCNGNNYYIKLPESRQVMVGETIRISADTNASRANWEIIGQCLLGTIDIFPSNYASTPIVDVVGVSPGTVTLRATTISGSYFGTSRSASATMQIIITPLSPPLVATVTITPNNPVVRIGETITVTATATNTLVPIVDFSVVGAVQAIASINRLTALSAEVTGLHAGNTYLRASFTDTLGLHRYTSVPLVVYCPTYHGVTGITLDYQNKSLEIMDSHLDLNVLNATVHPNNAPNRDVIFTTSDPYIATVDNNSSRVNFVRPGIVYITATSASNPNVSRRVFLSILSSHTLCMADAYLNSVMPTVRIETGTDERTAESYFGLTRNTWVTNGEFGSTISLENAWDASYNFAPTAVDVRGRGNSTWHSFRHSKQPIRVRFPNPAFNHRSMLDSGYRARNWSFISSHSDKTMMRHYTAYNMGRMLGSFASVAFTRFVHLYINGDYRGVYMLVDHMDNDGDGNRADIHWNPDDAANTEFYLEMCRRAAGYATPDGQPADFWFWAGGNSFEFREDSGMTTSPTHANRPRTVALINEAQRFIQEVHDTIVSRDWEAIQQIIDVSSMVDFYIVNEIAKDVDVAFSSVHMTVRGRPGFGETRRLFMGPLWDFDLAMGNADYMPAGPWENGVYRYNRYHPTGRGASRHVWLRNLIEYVPEFRELVEARFSCFMLNVLPQTIERVQFYASHNAACFNRNFVRWPILGTRLWPNPTNVWTLTTHNAHINQMTGFLQARAVWMNDFFASLW